MTACGGGGGGTSTNAPPVADLAAGDAVTAGQPLAFDASGSLDPDGDALRYSWSFGDGGRGGASRMAHVFASAGSYTVTLTVADGRGGADETTHVVNVSAAPPPTSMVTATVRVSSPAGERLAGAGVRVLGGASATTDAAGLASVAVGAGAPQVLRVERQGYARQTTPLTLPEGNPFVDVVLYPAGAVLALEDAAAGGSVSGTDGASVELPPGALIDDGGAAVSGAVDVAVTPLDVVNAGAAFPGKFEGVDSDGASGLLLSWGTMDVSFSQGGRPLNLAPGETATIEIPVYAGLALDGSPVGEGDAFPLWSLDETTGVWIQEGQGTIVASSGSPTGLALRGQVGHFSWWNCDMVGGTHPTQTRCCIDSNFDGECDGDTICYVRGRTNCAGSYCSADSKPTETPMSPPAYSANAVVGAGATLTLGMPNAYPVLLEGYAQNGTLYGKALVLPTTDAATIHLGPIDEPLPTQMITLPWDEVYLANAGKLARFIYDAPTAVVLVKVTRAEGSLLGGIVKLRGPTGAELKTATFGAAPGTFAYTAPAAGRYTLEVDSTENEPGSYRLEVGLAGDVPVVEGRDPAAGATGVALTAPIRVTFSRDIQPSSVDAQSFRVIGMDELDVAGTRSVSGKVATFTPTAELGPGLPHRVVVTTGIRDTGGTPLPGGEEWTFTSADIIGKPARLSVAGVRIAAIADDNTVFAVTRRSSGEVVAFRYRPGTGWNAPFSIQPPADATEAGLTNVAAAGPGLAMVVWATRNVANLIYTVWSRTYSPASGWSAPIQVRGPGDPLTDGQLALDASGRGLFVWRTSTGAFLVARWTGTAWNAPVPLPSGNTDSMLRMNRSGDAVLAVWSPSDSPVFRFDAGTETFTPIDPPGTLPRATDGGIDDVGNIFVFYGDAIRNKFVIRRDAETEMWGPAHTVPDGGNSNCFTDFAVSGDGTALTSFCDTVGALSPMVERWDGAAWTPPVALDPAVDVGALPTTIGAAAGGRFIVVWTPNLTGDPNARSHYRSFVDGAWETGEPKLLPPMRFNYDEPLLLGADGFAMVIGTPGITAVRLQ